MSVLVEALSVVVPRKVLDISFPGGTATFMKEMSGPDAPCWRICADDQLVSACFLDSGKAQALADQLCELGVVLVDDRHFEEFALVDQAIGPTMPCDWLEWRQHEEGFTSCWFAGSDPDALHTPIDWTPDQSRRLTRTDIRAEPGRCMKLAEENGFEIWLDFETGQMIESLTQPVDSEISTREETPRLPAEDELLAETERFYAEDPLMRIIRSALDLRGYKYHRIQDSLLTFLCRGKTVGMAALFRSDPKLDCVTLVAIYGSNVPAFRRVAVAEMASRANMRLSLGNFELDFEDGELRFRIGMDVEGGALCEKMVDNMIGAAIGAMDRFHQAFMQVAFGGANPQAALLQG